MVKQGNPINALTLPYNHTAVMKPIEKVRVFIANSVDDGIVMSKKFDNAIEVEFRDDETEKTITYDCEKGMFVPDGKIAISIDFMNEKMQMKLQQLG